MQTIIHQNRQTVAFIRQHDYYRALESSESAILHLQHHHHSRYEEIELTSAAASALDCLDQCMLLSEVDSSSTDNAFNKSDAFVYDHGILLPLTAKEYTMVSAVVIFNSALAHQLYAQQQQDKDTSLRNLQISKQLYRLAHGVHSRACQSTLFQFVVINNIAVIDWQSGNVGQSMKYFEHLMAAHSLLVDQGCTARLRHLRGFTRNLPSITGLVGIAAPAA